LHPGTLMPTRGFRRSLGTGKSLSFSKVQKIHCRQDRRRTHLIVLMQTTSSKWLDRVKEGLTVTKDLLEVLLKLAPLALMPPAMALWVFLRRIGWTEVFSDSIGSIPGLITLLVCAVMVLLLLVLQFCLPSFLVAPSGEALTVTQDPKRVWKLACWLHVLSAIVWEVSFGISILAAKDPKTGPIWVATGLSALVAVCFAAIFKRDLVQDIAAKPSWQRPLIVVLVSASPVFASFATALPLLSLMWITGASKLPDREASVVFMLCCVASIVGLFPGLAYLKAKLEGHSIGRAIKTTAIVVAVLCYFYLSFVFYFAPISSLSLRIAGVYDTRLHTFQILNSKLVPALRAVHIVPFGKDDSTGDGKAEQFFDAYVRYNFGGVKLFCHNPFELDSVTRDAVIAAKEQDKPDPYLVAGDWCVPAKADDVKPVRRDAR
ncbi:hypothetical protein, partial [Paraburkholderia sp. SIMBA_054]|uniref:hypothetical protein n=1 Tax=Paraburkholderia sp. SIMBA_054 TaxID=3085795 RepID=UPI00397CB5ED